jgi:hypothetical protein
MEPAKLVECCVLRDIVAVDEKDESSECPGGVIVNVDALSYVKAPGTAS